MAPKTSKLDARAIGETIGIDWPSSLFDVSDLAKGIEVESEHMDVTGPDLDGTLRARIAWAHLRECPDYYDRLDPVEKACKAKEAKRAKATAAVAAVPPHEHVQDNQGVCHTCGTMMDREAWDAYAGMPTPGWGKSYGGASWITREGVQVWLFRKGKRVRFYDSMGKQVGSEQANVGPAVAAAMTAGWREVPEKRNPVKPTDLDEAAFIEKVRTWSRASKLQVLRSAGFTGLTKISDEELNDAVVYLRRRNSTNNADRIASDKKVQVVGPRKPWSDGRRHNPSSSKKFTIQVQERYGEAKFPVEITANSIYGRLAVHRRWKYFDARFGKPNDTWGAKHWNVTDTISGQALASDLKDLSYAKEIAKYYGSGPGKEAFDVAMDPASGSGGALNDLARDFSQRFPMEGKRNPASSRTFRVFSPRRNPAAKKKKGPGTKFGPPLTLTSEVDPSYATEIEISRKVSKLDERTLRRYPKLMTDLVPWLAQQAQVNMSIGDISDAITDLVGADPDDATDLVKDLVAAGVIFESESETRIASPGAGKPPPFTTADAGARWALINVGADADKSAKILEHLDTMVLDKNGEQDYSEFWEWIDEKLFAKGEFRPKEADWLTDKLREANVILSGSTDAVMRYDASVSGKPDLAQVRYLRGVLKAAKSAHQSKLIHANISEISGRHRVPESELPPPLPPPRPETKTGKHIPKASRYWMPTRAVQDLIPGDHVLEVLSTPYYPGKVISIDKSKPGWVTLTVKDGAGTLIKKRMKEDRMVAIEQEGDWDAFQVRAKQNPYEPGTFEDEEKVQCVTRGARQNPSTFPKVCGCGRIYDKAEWEALPLVRNSSAPEGRITYEWGEEHELRDCPCGNTLAFVLADGEQENPACLCKAQNPSGNTHDDPNARKRLAKYTDRRRREEGLPYVTEVYTLCSDDCELGQHTPDFLVCGRCGAHIHKQIIEIDHPEQGALTVGSECVKDVMGWKWSTSHEQAWDTQRVIEDYLHSIGMPAAIVAKGKDGKLFNRTLKDPHFQWEGHSPQGERARDLSYLDINAAFQFAAKSIITPHGWPDRIVRAGQDLGFDWIPLCQNEWLIIARDGKFDEPHWITFDKTGQDGVHGGAAKTVDDAMNAATKDIHDTWFSKIEQGADPHEIFALVYQGRVRTADPSEKRSCTQAFTGIDPDRSQSWNTRLRKPRNP